MATTLSRYAIAGGGNWSNTATWSTTSGGVGGASVPVAGDVAYLDANSGQVTVDVTNAVCDILDTTNYNNTLTFTSGQKLTVGSICILHTNCTIAGTGTLAVNNGCNIFPTTAKTFSGAVTVNSTSGASTVITLNANWTVTGALTIAGNAYILNNTLSCAGLTLSGTLGSGTTVKLTGGTWSGNYNVSCNITLAGNVTISGTVSYTTSTILYLSGTITTTSSTLTINGSVIINTPAASMQWNNITFASSSPSTLSAALTLNGTLTISGSWTMVGAYLITCAAISVGSVTWIISNAITCSGTLTTTGNATINGAFTITIGGLTLGATLSGTSTLSLSGGTWSGNFALSTNLIFNCTTATVSGSVIYSGTNTMTYTAGTITTTSSTLTVSGSCTLNTNGINWNNITFNTNGNVTLISNLTVNGLTTYSNTASVVGGGTYTIAANAGLTVTSNSGSTGTLATIILAGTWQGGGTLYNSLNFAGIITVSGGVNYNTGTITWVSGVITTTSSTLTISGSTTLNTPSANVSWNNITVNTTSTITLSATLTCTGSFTVNSGISLTMAGAYTQTFFNLSLAGGGCSMVMSNNITVTGTFFVNGTATMTGAFNVSCANFVCMTISTSPNTFTFPASQTITVSTNLQLGSNQGSNTIKSGTTSTSFILKYQGTILNQRCSNIAFTDVDFSQSSCYCYNWGGSTFTRTNWIFNVTPYMLGGFFCS